MQTPWPIEVAAIGNVVGGATAWSSGSRLGLTVVAKATFHLRQNAVATITAPDPIVVADEHFDRTPLRSVERASDLVPYRPAADVTLVGCACAPQGTAVPSMSVRIGVFREQTPLLDKTLHVLGDRGGSDNAPRPFARVPLVYECASRSLENPVGMAAPPNVIDPRSPTAPAGFGPISRYWRQRRELVKGASRARAEGALPEYDREFPWEYFHAAPPDQRIGFLRGDEWIVMDGVHPEMVRVASRLPGARAAARLTIKSRGETKTTIIRLTADTLAIDAIRMTATVVWRARCDLDEGVTFADVSAQVGVELPDTSIAWPGDSGIIRRDRTEDPSPLDPPPSGTVRTMELDLSKLGSLPDRPVLPFQGSPDESPRAAARPLSWKEIILPRRARGAR